MPKNPDSSTHYHYPLSPEPISDEIKFLIACCRVQPDLEEIALQMEEGRWKMEDWKNIIALASRHGILPLVYKSLKDLPATRAQPQGQMPLGCYPLPAEILTELKARYMSISQRNMLMSAELIRIMKLLKEHHIEALAFKGPVLAQRAYGDITLRQFGDLDILVDEKEAYISGKVLHSHGFTIHYPLSILQNKTCLRVDSDFALSKKSNNILIEMHWRLFRKNIGHHLTFNQFSQDYKTILINSSTIPTLSPELHLLYLSLHGSKHAWERIEWIVDIDRFIRNCEVDSKKLKEVFNLMKADRPILVGFLLTHKLFQTPLPDWLTEKIELDNEIEKLYHLTIKLLNSGLPTMTEIKRTRTIYLYQRCFFRNPREKIKYFLESYFSISRNDCLAFPLPPSLNFLYLFIKPFRVILKYLHSKK